MSVFFTADHHFYHRNILTLQKRPYNTLEEMHEDYIRRWNMFVGKADTVYHLGDLSFATSTKTKQVLGQLNGHIDVVPGNHDGWLGSPSNLRSASSYITLLPPLCEIKVGSQYITLCHYALRVWSRSHYGSRHLHGHSHGSLPMYPDSLDVGVDVFPNLIEFEALAAHIKAWHEILQGRETIPCV